MHASAIIDGERANERAANEPLIWFAVAVVVICLNGKFNFPSTVGIFCERYKYVLVLHYMPLHHNNETNATQKAHVLLYSILLSISLSLRCFVRR